ncbi:MAG: Fe-S cluster assembly ATPase SufC, partial [Fibrobacteraceae bacterium]|nr:Fe-S cluster assembly ATPase SufC [Fibrobacteraceae bacterium]
SGGEKKRNEILQMAMLLPKVSFLDETDSGLDIDALRIVSNGINHIMDNTRSVILVTHYERLLDYVKPNFVHVLQKGKIVLTGGPELAKKLEKEGYDWIREEA